MPKPLRKALGIEKGGTVVAKTSNDGVILKPDVTFPAELYSDERVAEFDAAEAELRQYLKRKRK